MSQSAPPGLYTLQNQSISGQQGAGTPGGPQQIQIAPVTSEIHYAYNKLDDGNQGAGVTQVDSSSKGVLSNRVSIEFYNAGTQNLEVDTNSAFTYGTSGRLIVPGGSWVVMAISAIISGGVKHYARCAPGQTCDLRVTELGQ